MRSLRSICFGALAASLVAVVAVQGQQPPAPREPQKAPAGRPADGALPSDWNDRDVRELVNAVMMARISKELNLSDEQTVLMMRRFDEHREVIEKSTVNRNRAFKELKEAIASNASDDALQKKLKEVIDLDKKLAELREEAFKNISVDMTPKQQAQMYVFIMDFENHMRRLIQRAKELGGERLMRLKDEAGMPPDLFQDRRPAERPRRPPRADAPDNAPIPRPVPKDAPPAPPQPQNE